MGILENGLIIKYEVLGDAKLLFKLRSEYSSLRLN